MKPDVLVLAGPTGCGKTDVALELAELLPLEVIGADSVQVYRHLDTGTAKPPRKARERVPHHLIDVLDPDEAADAAWYSRKSREAVEAVLGRGRVPFIVGGSGFYLRALERPPTAPPAQAVEIPEDAYAKLQAEDPEAAARIHKNDRYRIGRALALLARGEKPSRAWSEARRQECPFNLHWVGLDLPREELYDRINRRVDRMIEDGLVSETREVVTRFPGSRKRLKRFIGYREALDVVEGRADLEAMSERVKQASRNYAKRQITWFRAEGRMAWVIPTKARQHLLALAAPRVRR